MQFCPARAFCEFSEETGRKGSWRRGAILSEVLGLGQANPSPPEAGVSLDFAAEHRHCRPSDTLLVMFVGRGEPAQSSVNWMRSSRGDVGLATAGPPPNSPIPPDSGTALSEVKGEPQSGRPENRAGRAGFPVT